MFIRYSWLSVGLYTLMPVAILSLFFCTSLAAQDKVKINQPPQSNVEIPPWPPTPVSPRVRNSSELPGTRIDPRKPASLEELRASVHRLQIVNAELQAIKSRSDADLQNIGRHALDIHGLAVYLKTGLGLERVHQPDMPQTEAETVGDPLAREVSAIDRSIDELVNNPVAQQQRTVDAQLVSDAVVDLNKLILSSSRLEQLASDRMSPKGRRALAKLHARLSSESPLLQIDLDCDLWTTDSFAGRAAKVEKRENITIEGVTIAVRYHKLLQEEVVPLGECAGRPEQRKAEEYAAAIRDFTSLEVKGRVWSYQVTYRILITKNGKTRRAAQLLYLYYIDESGQGTFDLDTGKTPMRFLPEWVKELAAKRQAQASLALPIKRGELKSTLPAS